MTRVTAEDGSVFALRLPEEFGTRFRSIETVGANAVAALEGDGFEARIEIGFCNDESFAATTFGLPMAPILPNMPPSSLSFCRPDEFVLLTIEPVPDAEHGDGFDIIPIAYGDRYVEWVRSNIEPYGPCCFDDRGPQRYEETLVVADGYGSTQVTGLDAETLVPTWTTDLGVVLDGRGEWIGGSSRLLALTGSGTVITTTDHGFLVALDARSGEPEWIADLDGEAPGGVAHVDENRMVVTSSITSEGDLTAPTVRLVDLGTGQEIWRAKANDATELQWTHPVIMGELIVVADVPSYRDDPERGPTASITAFDLSAGTRAWTSPLDSTVEGYASFETIVSDSAQGLLLVNDVSGSLYRLDPETGARMWTSTMGFGPIVALSPEAATVLVAGREIDVDLDTGEVLD